jgi:sugar phosphate isomerase/epimerase
MTDLPTAQSRSRRDFLCAAGAGIAATLTAQAAYAGESATARVAKASGDAKLPLGLASFTTRKFTLDETIAMCKRLELDHLCLKSFHLPLDASKEEITSAAEKVRAAGLTLYGCGVVTMKNQADVDQAFAYAEAAGMTTIVGVAAPDILPAVEKKIRQTNIKLAIHNHGPGDKLYPTPESVYKQVKSLGPRIGLCIDIGHTLRIGADPVRDAERFQDRLLDLHIKDVSAASPEGNTVEIGRGVIDIPAMLGTLLKINYQGIVSFEYEKDESDPLPGLAESVGYVRGALAAMDG